MHTFNNLSMKKNCKVDYSYHEKYGNVITKTYYKISKSMYNEMNILAFSSHNNIVSLIDIMPFSENGITLILKKESHEYYDIICQPSCYNMLTKIIFLLQIAYAIKYLHHNNIIHCDLKSDNIMITDGICKIIDFGSSEFLINQDYVITSETKCTTTHRPPEGFLHSRKTNETIIGPSFDIWSFGIIILETFSNLPIYRNIIFPIYDDEKIDKYDHDFYNFIHSSKFNKFITNVIPRSLKSCLHIDPSQRPTIDIVITRLMDLLKQHIPSDDIDIMSLFDNNINFTHNKILSSEHYNYFQKINLKYSSRYI